MLHVPYYTRPKAYLFYIGRQPSWRTIGSRPNTPAPWCGNGCPHVRPHPGLTN